MSTRQRRHVSPEQKVAIVRRHLLEQVPVSDLCDEHGIHPTLYYRWQKQLFEKGALAFERQKDPALPLMRRIAHLEAKLTAKNEVIYELMEDRVKTRKDIWGCLSRTWTAQAVRDSIVDYVRYWSRRTDIRLGQLLVWIGIPSSKYYDWCRRYGQRTQHNAAIPRRHWLHDREKHSILAYQREHPEEGYRRLTSMMLEAGVVAASPSTVYRVLRKAGRLGQRQTDISLKGKGYTKVSD